MDNRPEDDFRIDDTIPEPKAENNPIPVLPETGTPEIPMTPPPLPIDVTAGENIIDEMSDAIETEAEQTESATTAATDHRLEELTAEISALSSRIGALQACFDSKIAVDEHKDQLFDKMYGELSSYKNDLYAKILKPFVMATIMLLDDVNKFMASRRPDDEQDAARTLRFLSQIPDDLTDILESNGVETYSDTESETFNPRTQRAVKQIATDNPELDNRIASRVRPGYRWNGAILRPEMVEITKFRKQ